MNLLFSDSYCLPFLFRQIFLVKLVALSVFTPLGGYSGCPDGPYGHGSSCKANQLCVNLQWCKHRLHALSLQSVIPANGCSGSSADLGLHRGALRTRSIENAMFTRTQSYNAHGIS